MRKNAFSSLSDTVIEEVANRFRALSEVSRLRIVQALHSGEMNVSELVEATGLSQPNVSRHLKVLLQARLIGRRKAGTNVVYKIVDETLGQLCAVVCKQCTQQ